MAEGGMTVVREKTLQKLKAYAYLEFWTKDFLGRATRKGLEYKVEKIEEIEGGKIKVTFTMENKIKKLSKVLYFNIDQWGLISAPDLTPMGKFHLFIANISFVLRGRK